MTISLDAGSLRFTPRVDGLAACGPEPDGRTVASVGSDDLGELGPGTLRGGFPLNSTSGFSAEIFVDGGDLPEGEFQPFWHGTVKIVEGSKDLISGRLEFAFDLYIDPHLPSLQPSTTEWPAILSGTLTWVCDPY